MDGDEVVQCYLGRPETVPDGVQCVQKALVDFNRIFLKKGEQKEIRLHIPGVYFQYYSEQLGAYQPLSGTRKIMIGASSRDIRLETKVIL